MTDERDAADREIDRRLYAVEQYAKHDPGVDWPSTEYPNPESAIMAALDRVREEQAEPIEDADERIRRALRRRLGACEHCGRGLDRDAGQAIGIPYHTLQRFARGQAIAPPALAAIADWLREHDG